MVQGDFRRSECAKSIRFSGGEFGLVVKTFDHHGQLAFAEGVAGAVDSRLAETAVPKPVEPHYVSIPDSDHIVHNGGQFGQCTHLCQR